MNEHLLRSGLVVLAMTSGGAADDDATVFREQVQPILRDHC